MKKFKVIEESRFLKKQDMQDMIGGRICTGTGTNFTICQPISLNGFNSDNMCGITLWGTCDEGWEYNASGACLAKLDVTCPGFKGYIGPIPPPIY